ncbi:ATP-dependent exoDNAse (exonuclease V) beta-subunit (contains helicaseand exonuclease domains) [gamma proteobacterium HdN1]|nr:ATP-dependent exoDNAse (exonuclease V) beta-subunit (contains helicaseand exonuclease domains) [gamma proteobacterium HdN1]
MTQNETIAPEVLPLALRLPLQGVRLIEASAGTGKTFTIAALYLRLILGHQSTLGRPLTPRDILVVTFTQAAAEELRGRIRARLYEGAQAMRGVELPSESILCALYQEYEAQGMRERAGYLLQQAAENMDEAAIYTIHAWCQQVLQQHAFASGASFGKTLQQDEKVLLEVCVRDYWRSFFYSQGEYQAAWLFAQWKTPEALLEALKKPLELADSNLALPSQRKLDLAVGSLMKLRVQIANGGDDIAGYVEEALKSGALNKKTYKEAALYENLLLLLEWARSPENTPSVGPSEIGKLLKFWSYNELKRKTNKGKAACPPDVLKYIDEHLEKKSDDEIKHDYLLHAVNWVRKRMVHEKAQRSAMYFDDLINDVESALTAPNGSSLATLLRDRFPVAMIDEFQDTDQTQYSSFRAIYADSSDQDRYDQDSSDQDSSKQDSSRQDNRQCALLLIGDPKQAIYSFRGADIFTYLQARKDTHGKHYTLDTNYRSVDTLIRGVNALFSMNLRQLKGEAFIFSDIPFLPVNSAPAKSSFVWNDKEIADLCFWTYDAASPEEVFTKGEYQMQLAAKTANTIVELLQASQCGRAYFRSQDGKETPLKAADIAILVRSRGEASVMRDALELANVRSVYLSQRDSVFASAEANTLLVWMDAVAQPENERLLRAALATPHLYRSDANLDDLLRDEIAWEETLEFFKQLRADWLKHGVLPMVRRLMQRYDVANHLLHERKERVLTNFLHLSEWLQTAAASLDGEHALIRLLRDKIRSAKLGQDTEENVLRLESDEQLLKIITIHKSKGLEYPLVFLPFASNAGHPDDAPFAWHDAQDQRRVLWNYDPEKLKEKATEAFLREKLAEDLRLFYVAVTRARHACWVGAAPVGKKPTKDKSECLLENNVLAWLLAGKQSLTLAEYQQALKHFSGTSNPIVLQATQFLDLEDASSRQIFHSGEQVCALQEVRQAQKREAQGWIITSYTGIVWGKTSISSSADSAKEGNVQEESHLQENVQNSTPSGEAEIAQAPPRDIHSFPAGAAPGTFLHSLLEWAGNYGFRRLIEDAKDQDKAASLMEQFQSQCERYQYIEWQEVLWPWMIAFLQTPLNQPSEPFSISTLSRLQYQVEMEFLLSLSAFHQQTLDRMICESEYPGIARPQLMRRQVEGMLKGFIDLVCEHAGRYYVVDYKSNYLGADRSAYTPAAMQKAILEHRYDVQYVLYTIALHRLLKIRLGENYDYDRHIGGAIYLFLRGVDAEGNGIFVRRIPYETLLSLEKMFWGETACTNLTG